MKRTSKLLLMSTAMLFAISGSAFAHQNAPKVFTGGTGATTNAVNIYQPTQNEPPVDSAEESSMVIVNKTIIYNIRQPEHETRAQRRKRALGHRYLGFIKQYSGYRYPF